MAVHVPVQKYRTILSFFAKPVLSLLVFEILMFRPASAQTTQCQLLGYIISLENLIDDLVPDDSLSKIEPLSRSNRISAQAANDDIGTLISSDLSLSYSSSVVGHEKWVSIFTSSRASVIGKYLQNDLRQSYLLKTSRGYRHISAELETLRSAVNCGFEAQRAGQSAFQQDGSRYDPNSDNSLTPTQTRQIKSGISAKLFEDKNAVTAAMSVVMLVVLIWAWVKYEAHKADVRRRYYCHIVVKLVTDAGSYRCNMVDISRSGAGIILDRDKKLSDTILVSSGSWSEKAHLIWRQGNLVGVKFSQTMKSVPEDFKKQIKRKGNKERKEKKLRKS